MAIQKITASVLGNNAVTAANVAAGALSAADIADNSLTAAKLSTSTFAIDSLTVNTSDLVVDTANSKVGIGTASPNGILHIKGLNDASTYVTNQKSSTKWSEWHVGGTHHYLLWDSTGDLRFGTETGLGGTGASEKMRITSDGLVGIGEIDPQATLHVEGKAFIGESSNVETEFPSSTASLHIHEIVNDASGVDLGNEAHVVISTGVNATGAQGYQGSLWFGTSDHPAGGSTAGAGAQFVWRNAGIASTSGTSDTGTATGVGNLEFFTNNGGAGGSKRMTIAADGNVGVGNANTDNFKLYVDSTSTGKGLYINAQDGGYTAIGFSGDGTATKASFTTHNGFIYIGSENVSGTGSNGELRIEPSTSERMRITSSGDVNVSGGQLVVISGAASAPSYSFEGDTNTGISRPTSDAVNIITGGTERMRIDGGGRVTMPYQPAFCVANPPGTYPVAGIFGKSDNPTTGSSYTIHVNQGSHFSTSTGRFTAPIAGKYYFSFSAMFDSNGSTNPGFDFKVNGSGVNGGEGLSSGTASYEQLAGSILLDLSANDYVELSIRGSRIHQRYGSFEGFLVA